MNKKTRRTCSCCKRKLYVKNMKLVSYPLLHTSAYSCTNCLSRIPGNLQIITRYRKPVLLELFSGSKTVSNIAADHYSYKTITVDINEKFSPALCKDILKLSLHQLPDKKNITLVWASIPCPTFSIQSIAFHWRSIPYAPRQYFYLPVTESAINSIKIIERTLWLIRNLPQANYIIENPRGAMRHLPQMQRIPFMHSISYHDYGAAVYKPTDLFTNIPALQFKKIAGCSGRTFPGSVAKMNNSFIRSVVPPGLVHSILSQIKNLSP